MKSRSAALFFFLKIQENIEQKNAQLLREQESSRLETARIREAYHEQKMRQQIRENNQELRILESQLRTAYVSKALAAQKKKHEAMQLAEKIILKQEHEELEKARMAHLEELKQKQETELKRKKKLHEDLTNQIISAHQQHQRLYEEFLREKYYLDEIAKRVTEELIEQTQKKVELREKTKKEMEAFKIEKQELERLQQIDTEEENQRIIKYCQERDRKIQLEEKRRQELEKNRKNLNEKMVAELSELSVSFFHSHIFNFVGESHQESVDMFTIRKALTKALKQQRFFQH